MTYRQRKLATGDPVKDLISVLEESSRKQATTDVKIDRLSNELALANKQIAELTTRLDVLTASEDDNGLLEM